MHFFFGGGGKPHIYLHMFVLSGSTQIPKDTLGKGSMLSEASLLPGIHPLVYNGDIAPVSGGSCGSAVEHLGSVMLAWTSSEGETPTWRPQLQGSDVCSPLRDALTITADSNEAHADRCQGEGMLLYLQFGEIL